MAMHYQFTSELQAEGLRTVYLMNPNFVGFPDQSQSSTCFFNAAAHAPLTLPLQFATPPHDPGRPAEEIEAAHRLSCQPYDHHQEFLPTAAMSPLRDSTAYTGSLIMGSKYVKAAQELLDEVASVIGKGAKNDRRSRDCKAKTRKEVIGTKTADVPTTAGGGCNEGGGVELTTAQRQEILMKKAKLSSMSDEVDQRCKQYHHQMQFVVSSFEQLAGIGSARSYTQVALRTILRQFRCLKATILGQIKVLNKSLGGEETEEGSRLRLVDHCLRQQRTLQQLGMMMSSSSTGWRPQRGLPERAVAVLRAWLFEHFLHPYPKDSDKQMLAKRTGLTRSQVSNWFINARVRLWKPMVEEMYLEEIKNQHPTPCQDPDNLNLSAGPDREPAASKTTPTLIPTCPPLQSRPPLGHLITSLDLDNPPKKPRQDTIVPVQIQAKPGAISNPGFGPYGICQLNSDPSLGSSFSGSSFSLSLGLPPLDTSPGSRQGRFMSTREFDFGTRMDNGLVGSGRVNSPGIGYEILDFQDRKSFQAQALPDFVT